MKNKNPFKFSLDNKRYHTLNYFNMGKFGQKIYKAALDCGFTCPNIDGRKGTGGCIFCDSGSGYFTCGGLSIEKQLEKEILRISEKIKSEPKITAYFQANTNTYASTEELKSLYNTALSFPQVCGISIGTRADCLPEDVLDVLEQLSEKTFLTVELGLQSIHNSTAEYINRCLTHEEFIDGYYKLKKRGIRVCIHIINGLPNETSEMMLETTVETAKLHPDALKIQMLHIIEGTHLAEIYKKEHFQVLSRDEYIDIVTRQLEVLPPETVIERITGDGDKAKLIAPKWSADKISVLGGIDRRQAELDSWQGKLYCY